MICSTPRSGSNLLCELAIQTGRLGFPDESLGKEPVMRAFAEQNGLQSAGPEALVQTFIECHQTPNGVFGFKAHFAYFDALRRQVALSEMLPRLRYIYIDRRDHLRQAISLTKAVVTGHWSTQHPKGGGSPVYSADAIRSSLYSLLSDKAQWESFFALADVAPVRIHYEDLVADPNKEFAKIADALSLDLPQVSLSGVQLQVQRDDETESWRTQAINDSRPLYLGGPGALRHLQSPSFERRRRV